MKKKNNTNVPSQELLDQSNLKQSVITNPDNNLKNNDFNNKDVVLNNHNIPFTKVMSFQKSFSNLNGDTQIDTRKIIADGNSGKIYQNINGTEKVSDLDSEQLKDAFQFPGLNLNSLFSELNSPKVHEKENISIPSIVLPSFANLDTGINKLSPLIKSKYNWNNILLIIILILLVYIAIKLTFKK